MATRRDLVTRAIDRLARAADPIALAQRSVKTLADPQVVARIADEVPRRARLDLAEAGRLAQAAIWLARRARDPYARARAWRADGHVLSLRGRARAALRRYDAAAGLFARHGLDLDRAITDSGALQTLIYLGRYTDAFARARRARRTFRRHHDRARLARLDSNVGNVLFRQDHFGEALRCYRRAVAALRVVGTPRDVAVAMRNMAACLTSLHRFDQAIAVHREARALCTAADMPLMVAEADYNIAYLYYLRGDYQRALDLYRSTREHCLEIDDRYHGTLCDLDQAELCLELNDREQAERLASRAAEGFAALGMRYEHAKALAFLALALARRGETDRALALLDKARRLFAQEGNRAWPALIDLYAALIRADRGDRAGARRLATLARRTFVRLGVGAKAALCDLLIARIARDCGRPATAHTAWRAARARLARIEAPALAWRLRLLEGQFHEADGNLRRARSAYLGARRLIEGLRRHLRGDQLKVAFLSDKLAVYESLVAITLRVDRGAPAIKAAWRHIEEAKSRGLADLIAFRAAQLQPRARRARRPAARLRALGEELHWFDREIERQEVDPSTDPRRLTRLRLDVRARERLLAAPLAQLRAADREFASLQAGGLVDLDEVRTALPANATLLEYYRVRDTICACIVSHRSLDIVALADNAETVRLLRSLHFQLGKFRLGEQYTTTFGTMLRAGTLSHLRRLHASLVAPLLTRLDAEQLIVVPHESLHYLPFHALWDGRGYLGDRFAISYAPSASVYARAIARSGPRGHGSLILGVGDARTPHIAREVRQVAAALPDSELYVEEDATAERLRTAGARARYLHIATHGLFRHENPMLSAVRLTSGDFSVADFYQLTLSADLVTLSGCGTGVNAIVGGDELIGLTRGLLYAGARALLLTLWDVADESTREFMRVFYAELMAGTGNLTAMQTAMRAVRDHWPHPYHWAPFLLIGDARL